MRVPPTLATIGYEGASLLDFVSALRREGVQHVLDVRDRPISRKPGFSKRLLGETLLGAGIGYSHLQALGDPKPGRDAMRAGRVDEFREIFAAHLDRPEAGEALATACAIASRKNSVLLCFEADHQCCHRHIVANRMAEVGVFAVQHLQVACPVVPRRRRGEAGAFAFG